MSSEYVTIVEAHDHSEKKQINPIAKIIKDNKKQGLTFLEILVKACNCTLNKKHGYILDNADRVVKISQLFEYLNIVTSGGIRCPKCLGIVSFDLLPYHFEDHNFNLNQICKLWERNFLDWQYQNSEFRYLGEKIAI